MALSNQNQYFMILNLARQKQTEKTEEITYCCTLHHLKNHKSKHQLSAYRLNCLPKMRSTTHRV